MFLTFTNGQFYLLENGAETALSLPDAVKYGGIADKTARKVFDRILVTRYESPSAPLPPFLDPHQVVGVRHILTRSRSYLAHAPGAGKTAQAIVAAVLTGGRGKVVFIVPPTLTVNWEREIWKFTEWAGVWPVTQVIPGTDRKDQVNWGADFFIVPDSMLTKDWVMDGLTGLDIRFIAVDEASRFKEPTAQRTLALFGGKLKGGRQSHGLIAGARHAVLLDGSPMPNRPMELWAPTYAMAPEAIGFMSQQDFGFRYCGAKMNDFGQWEFKYSSNETELSLALQKDFMHVVTEGELCHPERRRSMLFMPTDVRSVQHKAWEKGNLSVTDFSEEMCEGALATFRAELGLRKVPFIADYVAERLERKNESILLFVWHRNVAQLLAKRLSKFSPALVIGGTPEVLRESAFKDFQEGKTKLIIGNISAMGRGHNLQKADRVIFGEFSWGDETNKQAEKRASRRGSTKLMVRCEYIVCPNSMDEPVLSSVFRKANAVRRIIG